VSEVLSAAVSAGAVVGFSLGLIGGGGSILATPLLLYFVGGMQPHTAIGTGALAVSVTAFINLARYASRGAVRWCYAIVFAIVGTMGAFLGSTLGKYIEGQNLLFLFGFAMIGVGLAMSWPATESPLPERDLNAKSLLFAALVACFAGIASGFFGIGGGFLIVPGLIISTRMSMINAVGSSLLPVGCFGLATAMNYAVSGLVDWRMSAFFIVGGICGGFFGVSLADRLSSRRHALKGVFAGVIFVVAIYVIYRSGQAILR
jgi:uncharacterized membrane protein YfcA